MGVIDSENSNAPPADKDGVHNSSGARQDLCIQTANNAEQAEEIAPALNEIAAADPRPESKPETQAKVFHSSTLATPQIAILRGEHVLDFTREEAFPPHTKLSAKAQHLCRVADEMLSYMAEVEETMQQFQEYVQSQKDDSKPLYKWTKYNGYRSISRAISELDEAADKFEPVHLPSAYVHMYLSRATKFSLSVSKIAVFAMGIMSEKSATCIDEIEESELSADGKTNAKALITNELKKLLKYCARATDRVYAALDLLRRAMLIDGSHQTTDISIIKKLISDSEGRMAASRKSCLWTIPGLILGAAASTAIGITAAHLYGSNGFDLALKGNDDGVYARVMDLVQRTQVVTNLTGEVYSIKLQDIEQRCKEIEGASESYALRIDNLVEALGVPNEEGTYFSSTPKPEYQVPNDIRAHIQKMADDADHEFGRLHKEMEQMRKNVNRMDIRLTKRLDRVDRHGL
ncbi:hypothetical protein EJ02DRAFT_434227 [Clathrospora elynae]|uniref:Uncharacterized protein n=1 Tax=Clathrospora elynae TaxID=706981 RepID=A0A6A5SQ17_9PLEO|nr:hypothetical protein EJ02DRAFT_434227 [Clathrospora elynae]